MKKVTFTILLVTIFYFANAQAPYSPAFASKHHRQFDFWIGVWDVNLRTQREDGSWEDQIKAEAHIYPILDGKAILELWNETSRENGIKGFSLRYYREDLNQWELWLNWPGPDRSGTSNLTGQFRHGRGEFFSTQMTDDTTELISRYTFTDITRNSLRWDDAYSTDGGKTWSNQWIMEFDRKRQDPPPVRPGMKLNTYTDDGRCSLEGFTTLQNWAGDFSGEIEYLDNGRWERSSATFQGYPILEGCAVIHFMTFRRGRETHKSFGFHTYNTYSNQLEYDYLDNIPGNVLQSFFGEENNGKVEMDGYDLRANQPTNQRFEWTFGDRTLSLEVYEEVEGQWTVVLRGRFRRS